MNDYQTEFRPKLVAFCEFEQPSFEKAFSLYYFLRIIPMEEDFQILNDGKQLKLIYKLINLHYKRYGGVLPYYGKILYYTFQMHEFAEDENIAVFGINGRILGDEADTLPKRVNNPWSD